MINGEFHVLLFILGPRWVFQPQNLGPSGHWGRHMGQHGPRSHARFWRDPRARGARGTPPPLPTPSGCVAAGGPLGEPLGRVAAGFPGRSRGRRARAPGGSAWHRDRVCLHLFEAGDESGAHMLPLIQSSGAPPAAAARSPGPFSPGWLGGQARVLPPPGVVLSARGGPGTAPPRRGPGGLRPSSPPRHPPECVVPTNKHGQGVGGASPRGPGPTHGLLPGPAAPAEHTGVVARGTHGVGPAPRSRHSCPHRHHRHRRGSSSHCPAPTGPPGARPSRSGLGCGLGSQVSWGGLGRGQDHPWGPRPRGPGWAGSSVHRDAQTASGPRHAAPPEPCASSRRHSFGATRGWTCAFPGAAAPQPQTLSPGPWWPSAEDRAPWSSALSRQRVWAHLACLSTLARARAWGGASRPRSRGTSGQVGGSRSGALPRTAGCAGRRAGLTSHHVSTQGQSSPVPDGEAGAGDSADGHRRPRPWEGGRPAPDPAGRCPSLPFSRAAKA